MNEQLRNTYNKLINKHYAAVQTDTKLEYSDSYSLEKKSKQFWDDFYAVEAEFKDILERCEVV